MIKYTNITSYESSVVKIKTFQTIMSFLSSTIFLRTSTIFWYSFSNAKHPPLLINYGIYAEITDIMRAFFQKKCDSSLSEIIFAARKMCIFQKFRKQKLNLKVSEYYFSAPLSYNSWAREQPSLSIILSIMLYNVN